MSLFMMRADLNSFRREDSTGANSPMYSCTLLMTEPSLISQFELAALANVSVDLARDANVSVNPGWVACVGVTLSVF